MKIRKARITDLKQVHKLINDFARREAMLPRSLNELYETLRDFCIYDDREEICGVCALHIMWEDLAEIRSLAVDSKYQNKGIGKNLVKQCLKEAKMLGIKRVFALTYHPEFFKKLGFEDIDKARLPQKIWGDCLRCPKFPECDEHAVIINL
ncbi:MAG: N-acetyltransferase [Nitrospirae bacterium]|nr:N-acetyltransferase [Nitrospirota bacterium]